MYPSDPCKAVQVAATLELFGALTAQHADVAARTSALHDACEQLVTERERLASFAGALRAKLAYFDELDQCAGALHATGPAIDALHFLPMLARLDECITCVLFLGSLC